MLWLWLSEAAWILARMSDSIKLGSVALECPDARQLAAFYAEITGGTVTSVNEDWATAKCPGGDIDFQTAPGYQRPAWPDPSSSMQMHLDFLVDDADAAEARVLEAGATKYDVQPGDHFRVRRPGRPPVLPVHRGRAEPGMKAALAGTKRLRRPPGDAGRPMSRRRG